MNLCLGCMEEMGEGLVVCPRCGYNQSTPPKEIYHLPPGTILHNKYIMGKVLGYGGFGVTYIGYDYNLGRKVAIKEFLPGDFSTRMPGQTLVTVYDGEATSQFEAGLDRFVQEAQRLAKLNYVPGVVDIYDTFIENNTGYIVMQFLDGDTVRDIIDKYGVMPYESAKLIMVEILKTLAIVHREGIIHRDISPDNVFITKDNEIKILDFGAARYASAHQSKSLSVILKPGYAPEEQYRTRGNQGPWSDVYACGATMYKMITGITIEDAMERNMQDNVKSPAELGVDLPESANNAIMNALNIHAEMRTQSAEAFIEQLGCDEVERVIDKPIKTDSGKIPTWLKAVAGSVFGVAFIFALLIVTGVLDIGGIIGEDIVADERTRVPYVMNLMKDEGEEILDSVGFAMLISDMAYDEFAEKDIIKTQTPAGGQLGISCPEKDNKDRYVVYVTVSGGHAPVVVPHVVDMALDAAKAQLEELGFVVEVEEEYNNDVEKGIVMLQDISNIEYAYGSTIHLTVSKGEMKVDKSKQHRLPNLVGMNYEDALKKLSSIGMYVKREERHDTAPDGEVVEQSIPEGTDLTEGETITLTVSSNVIVIPDVTYKQEDVARGLIESAGATVTVKYEKSSTVKSGNVISQSVVGKSTYGTKVKLVVSSGFESTKTKEKCPDCGSTSHTQHPTCPVCGSKAHTLHPACAYCGSTSHNSMQHPRCTYCGSTQHTTDGHQKCTYCGSTAHSTETHPKCATCGSGDHTVHPEPKKCPTCGSTEHTVHYVDKCAYCGTTAHTTANHPRCASCGSTSHTVHPKEKCAHCGSTNHTTQEHILCTYCNSPDHNRDEHPRCSICTSAYHTTANHPKCTYCGSTSHDAAGHPKCAHCGSAKHTTNNHTKCTYCGSYDHATSEHPNCGYCGMPYHTTENHPKCSHCGSTSHKTDQHPLCPDCNSPDHTDHPKITVPNMTDIYVSTSPSTAKSTIRYMYPECSDIKIVIEKYENSVYESGYVVFTKPAAGSKMLADGTLTVYVQK